MADDDRKRLWLVTVTKSTTVYAWAETEEDAVLAVDCDQVLSDVDGEPEVCVEPLKEAPCASDEGAMPWCFDIEDEEEERTVGDLWKLQERRWIKAESQQKEGDGE